jgi:lipoprotein-anchoring transpeptidase ErfK/SrfK
MPTPYDLHRHSDDRRFRPHPRFGQAIYAGVVRMTAALVLAAVLLVPDTTGEPHRLPTTAPERAESHRTEVVSEGSRRPAIERAPSGVRTQSARFRVFVRPHLSAQTKSVPARNPIDQRLVLLVRHTRITNRGRWFEVLLPERPNGSRGWVRARDVERVRLRQRIKVDLSERSLTFMRNGRRVDRFSVAVGTHATPTPTGTFYVWARVSQSNPRGPYGVYALGLSAFSVLPDWPGGGRVAIHGTTDLSDTGAAVSHGCVRVHNPDMRQLRRVPMGTPVAIRP